MQNSMLKNFFKTYSISVLVLVVLLSPAVLVFANHTKGTYPTVGHLWMSGGTGYSGLIYTTSNNCNSSELNAYTRVKNSTTGTSEMSRWTNGIDMRRYTCTGTWDNYTDIYLQYLSHPASPGENHDTVNSSAYCAFWGVSYPCGVRSTDHIDTAWWSGQGTLSRERLIMHETGHAFGLAEHCTSDAIMNNGLSTCNGGKWTSIMQYQPTDRTGINNVYP